RRTSAQVVDALRDVPGLRDVRSTLQRGNPEIVLRLDRDRMSALGLDSGIVSGILATKVLGEAATRFAERERRIDRRVALPRPGPDRVRRLLDIHGNPAGSPVIPLSGVAWADSLAGPSESRRLGTTRGAAVQAAVQGFDIGSVQALGEDGLA